MITNNNDENWNEKRHAGGGKSRKSRLVSIQTVVRLFTSSSRTKCWTLIFRFSSVRIHQFLDRLHSSGTANVAPIKIGRKEVVFVLSLSNILPSKYLCFVCLTHSVGVMRCHGHYERWPTKYTLRAHVMYNNNSTTHPKTIKGQNPLLRTLFNTKENNMFDTFKWRPATVGT